MTAREHPMLFVDALARKLAAGDKTVSRRPLDSLAARDGSCRVKVGDAIWVRETWRPATSILPGLPCTVVYKAGGSPRECMVPPGGENRPARKSWSPNLHMPRWAARTLLRVTSVERETLVDLTDAEALAEGFASPMDFRNAWDAIYRGRGLAMDTRPSVWVIRFVAE